MTHGRFYRLQRRTISASFTDTQQQNADRKIILPLLFFLHLMSVNKHHGVTDKK